MRVNLRGAETGVSEKSLDESDIDPGIKELGRSGMSKHVGSDTSREIGLFARLAQTTSESLRRQGSQLSIE